MANVGNVVRLIAIKGTHEGVNEASAAVQNLAKQYGGVAVETEKVSRASISVEAAWKRQTMALDETVRSQDKMARATKVANDALAQGLTTQSEVTRRLSLLAEQYGLVDGSARKMIAGMTAAGDVSAVASHKMISGMSAMGKEAAAVAPQIDKVTVSQAALTKQSSRNAAEMLNLGRQFADVAVSLQTGQSILVVGLQQGAQIIDVIASSQRSMGQIASSALGWAKNFATSTAGIVTGLVAVGAAALMAGDKFQQSQLDTARALSGVGRAAQLSVSDIKGVAEQSSSVHGLSIKEAQEAASVFASTGKMYRENIQAATSLTHDFATALGVDTVDATKVLAEGLTTGITGIDKLDQKYSFLTASQREYLKDLDANVDKTKFQAAAIEMLSSKLVKASELTTNWSQGWTVLGNVVSNVFRMIGEVGTIAPTQDMTSITEKVKGLEQQREGVAGTTGIMGPGALGAAAAAAEVEKLNEQIANLNLKLTELQGKQLAAHFGELGKAALNLGEVFTQSEMKAKQLEDALKVLQQTRAMPEVGLTMSPEQLERLDRMIAGNKVAAMSAREAADMEARRNQYALQVTQTYGTQNIEVAKTLDSLTRQLPVAQAVGGMAQIEAQHKARVAELSGTLEASEAERIADAERLASLAQIEAQHQQTMVQLRGQLDVASQVTGIGQINAQYEATVASLELQIGSIRAAEQAELQRATAIAGVNAEADRTLKTLQQEAQLIGVESGREQARIRGQHTYNNLIDKGVDSRKAEAVAAQQVSNDIRKIEIAERKAEEAALRGIRTREDAWKAYAEGVISWSLANDEAAKANRRNADAAAAAAESALAKQMEARHQQDLMYQQSIKFTGLLVNWHYLWDGIAESVSDVFSNLKEGKDIWNVGGNQISQFNPAGYTSTIGTSGAPGKPGDVDKFLKEMWERQFNAAFTQAGGDIGRAVNNLLSTGTLFQGTALDTDKVSAISSAIDLLPKEQQIGPYQQMLEQFKAKPLTLETAPIVKQLTDKIAELTSATDANTSATNAQTDVLSPFYSSDPRSTHLGFRAFAGGGIMTEYGALPLKHYAGGGMATSPQVAVFGEGSTPEAYVPAPAGRIPVEIKTPANNNQKQRPVVVNINVMGNADAGTVAALKTTAFQQAQAMRRMMG